MRQTFCINFLCRDGKKNRQGLAPIELSLVINGQRTYITLQRKERPEDFKKSMLQKKDNKIKSYCETVRIKVNDIAEEMMVKGISLTAAHLKEYMMNGGTIKSYTIDDLFNEYLGLLDSRVANGDLGSIARGRYLKTSELFKEANNLSGEEPVATITKEHIIRMHQFLLSKYVKDTVFGYITRIKTFFRYAWETGKINSYPFSSFRIQREREGKLEFLTEDELNSIVAYHPTIERMMKVRDLFLFQCYTGLSYIDMFELKPEDVQKNDLGQLYIKKKREKTDIEFTTVLMGEAPAIWEKYKGHLPVLSNQKYNQYLKSLGDALQIQTNMTTKLARATYATYLLNKGLDIETVAKILGHANTKITRKYYAKLHDDTVFNNIIEMDKEKTLETPLYQNSRNPFDK